MARPHLSKFFYRRIDLAVLAQTWIQDQFEGGSALLQGCLRGALNSYCSSDAVVHILSDGCLHEIWIPCRPISHFIYPAFPSDTNLSKSFQVFLLLHCLELILQMLLSKLPS